MIAFVFPGQGAQMTGMGKEIIEFNKESREIFDIANNILDFDLYDLCFTDNDKINHTGYTQPALLTVSIAILKAIEKLGIKPDYVAGLSLGEYTSLVANGALDFDIAVDLVRKRGLYMEEAALTTEGSMAAVIGSDKELIKKICDEIEGTVQIANYNSPKQIVIAGEIDALNKAIEQLNELKIRVIPLKVSGAFHTILMKDAADKLEKYLENIKINPFKIPYYSNVTGNIVKDGSNVKPLLVKQVIGSVMWEENVSQMIENGVDTFIEIGPGKTLAGLIKKINRKVNVINVFDQESLNHLGSMNLGGIIND